MRPRLPSSATIAALEAIVLRVVAPSIGVALGTVLALTGQTNPAPYTFAVGLLAIRPLAKARASSDDTPPSIEPPRTPE